MNKSIEAMKDASGYLSDAAYTMRNQVADLDCMMRLAILTHIETAEALLERELPPADQGEHRRVSKLVVEPGGKEPGTVIRSRGFGL